MPRFAVTVLYEAKDGPNTELDFKVTDLAAQMGGGTVQQNYDEINKIKDFDIDCITQEDAERIQRAMVTMDGINNALWRRKAWSEMDPDNNEDLLTKLSEFLGIFEIASRDKVMDYVRTYMNRGTGPDALPDDLEADSLIENFALQLDCIDQVAESAADLADWIDHPENWSCPDCDEEEPDENDTPPTTPRYLN